MTGPVVIALLALQVAGFVVLFVVLRRVVMRRTSGSELVPELRAEVDALVTELNSTTERNVALLEDGVRRLQDLLRRVDGGAGEAAPAGGADRGRPPSSVHSPPSSSSAPSAAERRAQVLRLRRMGMSNAAIVDQLATNPGEVELIVNLADRAPGGDAP